MFPATYTANEQENWKVTMTQGPRWSRHLAMAVIVNLLNLVQFFAMYRHHTGGKYYGAFIIVLVFVYATLGYYAASLYQQTRDWLKALPEDSKEAHQLLQLSYIGYRLYLLGLGAGFLVLCYFNLIR